MHAIVMKEVCMISHLERVDYKAFIGLDWVDDKHDVCVQDGVTGKREFVVIQQISLL